MIDYTLGGLALEDIEIDKMLRATCSLEALEEITPRTKEKFRTFGAIKAVFDRVCGDVVFDAQLAKRVISFQIGFINKNDDHIAFFGGVLTGVQSVKMTPSDMNNFFTDVVKINEAELEEELHSLPIVKPDPASDRRISGSAFNHVCLWLMHGFMNSELLKEQDRRRAANAAALILNYRYLTSLLVWYYKTPASPEYAQAAYARLTKRSAIKQYGSWQALLEARCQDFFPPTGLHRRTVQEYNDDSDIIYALNDSQGRIRSMMKHLMRELLATHQEGIKVKSSAATVEMDGEGFIKEPTKNLGNYTSYVFSTLSDANTFIKPELIGLIKDVVFKVPPEMVETSLRWMVENYKTPKGKIIDEFVEKLMVHSFAYLDDNRNVIKRTNDISGMLKRFKGVYTSSRSTDPRLFELRELAVEIATKSQKTKNASLIASIKTAIMLYVLLRAFTMQFYSR